MVETRPGNKVVDQRLSEPSHSSAHIDNHEQARNEDQVENIPRLRPVLKQSEHFECKIGINCSFVDIMDIVNYIKNELNDHPVSLYWFRHQSQFGHFLTKIGILSLYFFLYLLRSTFVFCIWTQFLECSQVNPTLCECMM
ncbi:hypothetical protein TorRG33x02_084870, partial [Trema orientale]